jgi:hypothetical protein
MEEFKKILALQHEIDQKLDEFITRTKVVLTRPFFLLAFRGPIPQVPGSRGIFS